MTKFVITTLVVVHLVLMFWHGGAHAELHIELSPAKNMFIYVVILTAPIVAAGLIWTRYVTMGLSLFVLSMISAFVFSVYHHYVLISPDHVHHLPGADLAAQADFVASAAVLSMLELGSALCGAFLLGAHRAPSRTRL